MRSFAPMESTGFDIIDASERQSMDKDRVLLAAQVKGLLNSEPVSIEEKGYLI